LKILKMQGHEGGTREVAEAYSQYLRAGNLPKDAESVRKLAVAFHASRETPLNIQDLPQISEHAANLRTMGHLTWDEILANFAILRKNESPEIAETNMRQIITELSTAASEPKTVKLLEEMGMTPADIDFEDGGLNQETLNVVLSRLKAGSKKVAPERWK